MSENVSDNLKTTVVKQIVYGNVSRLLEKKREGNGRTYVWTAFIRPYNPSEDLSTFIRRVQFKLHETFDNHIRVVNKPPFELTETGWGEFDISMKVFFVDPNEKPLVITHLLKLFHCDHDIMMGHKSLVREIYDEMVFIDPSPSFYRSLLMSRSSSSAAAVAPHVTDFKEVKRTTLAAIQELNTKITEAISVYREQLTTKREVMDQVRSTIAEMETSSDPVSQ